MNNYYLVALAVAFCGCASPPNDRSKPSAALEQRTGHGLSPASTVQTTVPATVSLGDGLSEDEAITLALWNNAAFLEILTELGVARADLIQAGLLPNPTLTMLFPVGPKQLEFTAKFPIEALWLRPRRVIVAKLDYEKTAEQLVQHGLDLIRNVKLAFTDLTLANQRVKLAEESAQLANQIEQIAGARLAAGEVSELDVSAAKVDRLQADEQLARFRGDAKLVLERLRHLIGLGLEQWTTVIVEPLPPPRIEPDVGLLVTNALAARPDLRAAELGLEAAGKRARLARAEIYTLTGLLDANGYGSTFEIGPGVDIPIPIFHQNQGGIALAKAKLEKAARQYVTVRDGIVLEVREAHARLLQAQESLINWRERILPPLEEAVRQAGKAYEAGDVSLLLVLETTRKLSNASTREAAVAADLRRAAAELERNIGGRLPTHAEHAKTNENSNQ